MTEKTIALVQRQNTVGSGPGLGEQRVWIGNARTAPLMTLITSRVVGDQIGGLLSNVMIGTELMIIEIAAVTLGAEVRFRQTGGGGGRTDQGSAASPTLVAEAAVVGMDPHDDLAFRCIGVRAADPVTNGAVGE